MNRLYKKDTALLSSIFMLSCLFSTNATAQMTDSPWSFNGQNRASIAALIQQVEEGSNSSSVTSSSDSGSTTTLVCGSNSSDSTATGNSVCIILNNSEGAISVGQDNTGIQDASSLSQETTNVDETINVNEPLDVDEILATLNEG